MAYALTGSGPYLLVVPGWLSHLEMGWAIPAERMFHEALSSGRTLVRRLFRISGRGCAPRARSKQEANRFSIARSCS